MHTPPLTIEPPKTIPLSRPAPARLAQALATSARREPFSKPAGLTASDELAARLPEARGQVAAEPRGSAGSIQRRERPNARAVVRIGEHWRRNSGGRVRVEHEDDGRDDAAGPDDAAGLIHCG
jgi:hypothetical protein